MGFSGFESFFHVHQPFSYALLKNLHILKLFDPQRNTFYTKLVFRIVHSFIIGASMTSLKIAQTVTEFIILFCAYLLAVTPPGWFRSWVALRMGDETGKELGLLTLNPFAHISVVGLICFLLPFYRFGWGRHVPVHRQAIYDGDNRNVKFAAALFADTLAHWLVALLGLVILGFLIGPHIFAATNGIIGSPLTLSYARILGICIHLSVVLCVVSFIVNSMTYYVAVHKPELYHDDLFNWYFLAAYLLIAITIGNEIICGVLYGTMFLSQLLCHMMGFANL